MDLMLSNFITDDGPVVEKKKKKSFGTDGGGGKFSMVFSNSQPVKAVVARKRTSVALKPSNSKAQEPKKAPFSLKPPEPQAERVVEKKVAPLAERIVEKKATPQKPIKAVEKFAQKPPGHKQKAHSGSDFSLTEKFNQVTKDRKSNMFDRMKNDMPKVELPEVHPLTEKVFSEATIDSLDIHPHSKKNVIDLLHFKHLTVVQNLSIPKILEGKDVLIRAQTGSGKTLAYALPLVERLHSQDVKVSRSDGILAVVIVPTRELALQTYELFLKLLKPYTWIVSGYLSGGEKRKAEKGRLRAGLNILISTPGRFCDHLKNTESMKMNAVKYLILDEADRLLELGYEKDVKEIVESIKANCSEGESTVQTVLLSATLTRSVKELAGLTLKDPEYVDTSDIAVERRFDNTNIDNMEERITIPATVHQSYIVIPPKLRLVTLSGVIAYEFNRQVKKCLVFMATQDLVDFHYDVMVEVLTQKKPDSDDEKGSDEDDLSESESEPEDSSNEAILLPKVSFFKLHGKMTQIERSSVFKEFRSTKSAVLLCTDVIARGIDVPSVDLVVQYHAPQILADYVHRVGRTARAGHSGKALLFVEPSEVEFIKYLAGKQIKLAEERVDPIFGRIGVLINSTPGRKNKNKEQASIELQHRFEKLIAAEKELFSSACKAFVSWVRYYSNFPKELRRIFAIKAVNMGHYAKCLGLRDPPKQFVREHTGPKEGEEHGRKREFQQRRSGGGGGRGGRGGRGAGRGGKPAGRGKPFASNPRKRPFSGGNDRPSSGANRKHQDLASYAQSSRMINTSEFASGLAPARKKARKN
ncbi:probable ATP-dependent RNA helicase CG8611 [Ochlerotatus camptorhynchus]|uniref:probable ATP-dependent RNA helicase CG8611 n=1 Tax=Ochlerotatus camptorhynchus TaxID=644619 RepID=UPI0031D72153